MIPQVYQGGNRNIASYDYTDIAEGTGIVQLYGLNTGLSGSASYILTKNPIYSDDIETAVNANGTWTFNLSPFNLPKIVKGTAMVSFSVSFEPGTSDIFVISAAVQKVSNGTATTIGSADSEVITSPGSAVKHHFTMPITLTQTHFKTGDNLRLLLTTDFNVGNTYLGHDPQNRTGTHVDTATIWTTKLELYIPFKINS